jgi:hypothetical protein
MSSSAILSERETVRLETGRVAAAADGRLAIRTDEERLDARRAVSCLVEPRPGDTVLFARGTPGACHVLAILERESEDAARLSFPGDVEIKSEAGRVSIASEKGIDLLTTGDTALVSRRLSVHAGEAEVHVSDLSFSGTFFRAQVETIKVLARAFDSVFERISQRVKRSFRRVEELDQLNAGQIDHRATKLMSLRGKYSMLTAEEDVRIDGDKILMG